MAATYPKNGHCTKEEQTAGSKALKCEHLSPGQAADVGPASPMRIYTRDYGKVRDPDQSDSVSSFLGNPLRW